MKKYLQSRQKKINNFTSKGVQVTVKDPASTNVDIKKGVEKALSLVPGFLLRNIDIIYIGDFSVLKDRKIQAMYKDSSIFLTNSYKNTEDMIDDIVHEIAHSIEEVYGSLIYKDKILQSEFISKRKAMWQILKDEGYDLELQYYLDTEYTPVFDEFLYLEVGYPTLSILTANIFYSPYAATSLREYFANGFEAFFMREDVSRLQKISPQLYKKISLLLRQEKN